MKILKLFLLVMCALFVRHQAQACSRVVYIGQNDILYVGRTLDWRTPIPTNLYVYPAGVQKESMPSGNNLKWTSKYGSVVAVGYDGGVTEGMNERGLAFNGLFCKGTIYPQAPKGSDMPVMSLAMFVSFFLDNFATVDEIEAWLADNKFAINGATFDGGTVSTLHWGVTDATGMTMMLEYVDGKLNTYKGRDLRVLTNDPPLPQMQAINKYWEQVGGQNMLPGTVRSSDRFARASFFINHVPQYDDYDKALGSIISIMGTVSVPYGYELPGEPNVSSTQWTSICDASRGRYYFRFAQSIGFMYVDMGRLILTPGAPILKLDTAVNGDAIGCVNHLLKKSEGFKPMY